MKRIARLQQISQRGDVMDGFQCCFCGWGIAQIGDDPVSVVLWPARDLGAPQNLWAHALCLHRSISKAPLCVALPGGLDVLPREIALKSASPNEVVLGYRDAVEALDTFARLGWRVYSWEGWVRTPEGAVGHGDAPQGTGDLSDLAHDEAMDLCRRTMQAAHVEWRGSAAHPGAELLFCITVAPA